MKRVLVFFIIIMLCVFTALGCGANQEAAPTLHEITNYKDIHGITDEEIAAIEALKVERGEFTFGALLSTEAFVNQDGTRIGFAVKFCDLLTELFGIDFNLKIYDWDELIEGLEACEIDFTGELTPTDERQQKYFMSFPIAERLLRIFTCNGVDTIKTEADVNGLTIGFLEDSTTENAIKEAYPVKFTSVPVNNYQTAIDMLESGEIDAFVEEAVSDPAFDHYAVSSAVFFPMVHEPVSMTTGNPKLAPIISAVSRYIASGGGSKLYALYWEGDFDYSKYKLKTMFSTEEKRYINSLMVQGGSVMVGFENDNYPISFYNENDGTFEGIAVDILSEIGDITGLRFEPALSENVPWADILEKMNTGEIAMVDQLIQAESRKGDYLWTDIPYASTHYALLSRAETPNLATYQVEQMTVGAMRGSGKVDVYQDFFPNNDNLILYDTQTECLDALQSGEIDLFMASEYNLLAETNYRERSGLKVNIRLDASLDSCFGFNKEQEILCSIINMAQPYVNTDMIEISWTGRVFDYSKRLAENRMAYMTTFLVVLTLILFVTIFLLIRNMRLSRKLKDLAGKDTLTDILNRRYFMELSMLHTERALRAGEECFIIIYDLDHFKSVNDNYGHLAGDKVLKETVQRVKNVVRPYDLFGRYGGEEFILLMPGIDKANVISVTNRIRQEICKTPVEYEGKDISISASFGIAYAAPYNDINTATRFADDALYQAKETGRNKVVFYEVE